MTFIQKRYGLTYEQELEMIKEGVLNPKLNYYYDVYIFYNDMLEAYKDMPSPRMTTMEDVCRMFKIKQSTLYKILKEVKEVL